MIGLESLAIVSFATNKVSDPYRPAWGTSHSAGTGSDKASKRANFAATESSAAWSEDGLFLTITIDLVLFTSQESNLITGCEITSVRGIVRVKMNFQSLTRKDRSGNEYFTSDGYIHFFAIRCISYKFDIW